MLASWSELSKIYFQEYEVVNFSNFSIGPMLEIVRGFGSGICGKSVGLMRLAYQEIRDRCFERKNNIFVNLIILFRNCILFILHFHAFFIINELGF